MNAEEERELGTLALRVWGIDSQLDVLVEECAELIFAVQKSRRKNHAGSSSICEELGDVQNCLNQIKLLYTKEEYEQIRQEKLNRMAGLLNADLGAEYKPELRRLPDIDSVSS